MNIDTISICLTAVATCVIAIYSLLSFKLSQELKRANEIKTAGDQEFREQVRDLYQAIVIATLISGPSGYELDGNRVLGKFSSLYNGKTEIFKKKP